MNLPCERLWYSDKEVEMYKEEDSPWRLVSIQDLERCCEEKPKHVVTEQVQNVKEEAEGAVSTCPVFWNCVAAGLLILSVLSGTYQFCSAFHRPSFLRPQVQVELLPVYEVPFRTTDQVVDGFFEEPRFSDLFSHRDECQGEAILHDGRAYLTSQHSSDEKGVVARPHSVGRVLHSQVLRMKHRGPKPGQESVASFQVTFVFSIENTLAGREATGDGFAFVMVPEGNVLGSAGGSLGVMDMEKESYHTFAVEFDTWKNPSLHDINNNHVGVNVNSMISVVAEKAGYWASNDNERLGSEFRTLDLTSGKIQAWIDYDGISQELTVRISPVLGKKPHRPLLRTKLDLFKIFNEYMSVGFSAATGDFAAKHIIHGWQFEESRTSQYWQSVNNVHHEEVSVSPAASETSRKSQLFHTRKLPRDISNLPVFRNPHWNRHSDMSMGPALTAFLASSEESAERRPLREMRKPCVDYLPEFPKMDFAIFQEHVVLNSLWILLCLASAVVFVHLLFITYRILLGCYDTSLDHNYEDLLLVYQGILDKSDEELMTRDMYWLRASVNNINNQSENLLLDRV